MFGLHSRSEGLQQSAKDITWIICSDEEMHTRLNAPIDDRLWRLWFSHFAQFDI